MSVRLSSVFTDCSGIYPLVRHLASGSDIYPLVMSVRSLSRGWPLARYIYHLFRIYRLCSASVFTNCSGIYPLVRRLPSGSDIYSLGEAPLVRTDQAVAFVQDDLVLRRLGAVLRFLLRPIRRRHLLAWTARTQAA